MSEHKSEHKSETICLGIFGSQNYEDQKEFSLYLQNWIEENKKPNIIISGGGQGVDILARKFAIDKGIPLEEVQIDKNSYGKRAEYMRNGQIAVLCNYFLIFNEKNEENNRISNDIIEKARFMEKKVIVYNIGFAL
jgi:hypothetical protein